jgi:hypothetical protein
VGQENAAATLRPALRLLLVLNVIPLRLLLANLSPVLARSYSRQQLWRFGVFALGGATVIPLGLVFAGDSTPLMLGAAFFLVLGSLAFRYVLVKIPHAIP